MSIARCVSRIMDRIAPPTLAQKWDNVSSSHFPEAVRSTPPPLTAVPQVGLLLGPRA